jgi:hypothetical protein
MSETTQPTPPAEPEYVPQHVLSSEDTPPPATQDTPPTPDTEAEADPAEEARKTERRREAQRIGYLTKQRYAEQRRAEAAEQRLAQMEQRLAQVDPQHAAPQDQRDLDQLIEQRAEQRIAQRQHDETFKAWDKQGTDEFGTEKFREACKTVAEMASDEQRATLRAVVMDTEGGQRAVMELADNPEEAERVLALPPHRMALALAKLGTAAAPARTPQSNLPAPIRPPTAGRARGEPDPERGSMEDWNRWSAKQQWRR